MGKKLGTGGGSGERHPASLPGYLGFSCLSSPSTAADSWNLKHEVCVWVGVHACVHAHARVCFLTLSLPLTHSQLLMLPVPLIDEDVRFYISWHDVWNYLKPRHWKFVLLLESVFLSNSPFVLKNFFVEKKVQPSSFSAFSKVFKICSAMSPEKQTSNVTSVPWNIA